MNILYNNLDNNSSKIIQDDRITVKLKEHQKTAIYAMLKFENDGIISFTQNAFIKDYHIYEENEYSKHNHYYSQSRQAELKSKYKQMKFEIESNYGILADKVGSGKTFETMGLIVYGQIPKERDRIISSSIFNVIKYKDTQKAIKTNLIVIPHNITTQWETTFKYSTLLTYVISKRIDVDFLEFEENIFDDEPAAPDADYNEKNCVPYYDCIIVSATMFDNFYSKFSNIKWARIIIDEIVSIKLPYNLEFKCNFIWFLTATPSGIKMVRRNYIRTLVSTMSDYIINNIIIKNNDDYVDESMKLPSIKQIIIKCLTPKELNLIKGFVDDEIITMLNAGNIQDAITKLNCNIETSETILEVITKKIKKELYNKRQELDYEQKRIPDDTKIHEEKIKKIQLKITELESKCTGIENRVKSFKEESCPICFEDLEIPMLTPCCNNLFCVKCLTNCNKCPLCREKLNISTCIVINDNKMTKVTKVDSNLCSKVDNLVTLIKANPTGKFIVFSNFDRTFENLNSKLSENNISNNRLIGSHVVINSIIKRFESGEIKVLMLNALNYGSGLNLQMATDIIIYHELDIELETQVIGRAQRLGRTTPLNVYYLLNDNEQINCKNPTLNLDIFSDNTTMLENFIKTNTTEIPEDNISDEVNIMPIKVKKTKTKTKTKT
jgi:hypothetical protein